MTIISLALIYALILAILMAVRGVSAGRDRDRTVRPVRRILIVGSTGGTGRELVRQALDRGYQVTAFARDPARCEISHPGLTIVKGDVMDEESVMKAVVGSDAVLSALGHRNYYSFRRVLSRGTATIIRSMEKHGVQRLVCETSLGLGNSVGRMGLYYTFFVVPFILPLYYWDKTLQERAIAASRLEWTIVRPGRLVNGARRGKVRQRIGPLSYLLTPRISRADTAAFMLDQLETEQVRNSVVGIAW